MSNDPCRCGCDQAIVDPARMAIVCPQCGFTRFACNACGVFGHTVDACPQRSAEQQAEHAWRKSALAELGRIAHNTYGTKAAYVIVVVHSDGFPIGTVANCTNETQARIFQSVLHSINAGTSSESEYIKPGPQGE